MDSIVTDAIRQHVFPGCQIIVARKGQIIKDTCYGFANYDSVQAVFPEMLYDLASCTKISATTMAIMKLIGEHQLQLDDTLGKYWPLSIGTDKSHLKIRDILLHQAGFVPFIPFYKMTLDSIGNPLPTLYRNVPSKDFNVEVTPTLYLKNSFLPRIDTAIRASKLGAPNKYVYSDNDFLVLQKVVERITGKRLDEYVANNFYRPLGMHFTTFQPLNNGFDSLQIAPTEIEPNFRKVAIRGTVHDPGAALMGGVAGHAGLFSTASDLSILYRMILNHGKWNKKRYLSRKVIKQFIKYNSLYSRRGLGFDKPEKETHQQQYAYPSSYASKKTFGHTGFTGTCIWADPQKDLLFIFLSNRVYPSGENTALIRLKIREKIFDSVYEAISE